MDNILDHVVVQGQRYDIVSPTAFGDYIETIGSACINPDGYAQGSTFLARLGNEQFYYEATAAITQGSAISEGTNCKRTTVTGREAELATEIETLGETVDSLNEALTNEVLFESVTGVKNLLPNNLTTNVINNITCTVNSDKSVSITTGSSSASGSTGFFLLSGSTTNRGYVKNIYNGMKLSGCPTGGTSPTYCLIWNAADDTNGTNAVEGIDFGDGVVINSSKPYICFYIRIAYGTSIPTPITFKPMVSLASDIDPTYQPYAMTNRELTEHVNGLVVEAITSDSTTIAANSNTTVYVPITKSNYTPLGVMGIISFSSELTIYEWGIGAAKTQAFAGIKNRGSSSVKGTLTFYVLYKKS